MDSLSLLLLLALFQVKHMFADFYLQTAMMLVNRAGYFHPGRALHCLVHVAGSFVVLLFFAVSAPLMLAVLVAEFLAHYHIDFGKGVWSERAEHTPAHASYWRAFGADQMLHHLTYVAMVWAII